MRKRATLALLLLAAAAAAAALVAPTSRSASAGTTVLAVRRCTLQAAVVGMKWPATPRTVTVSLPASLAATVAAYGRAGQVALGPSGWRCALGMGADGSSLLELRPRGPAARAAGHVSWEQVPACIGCIGDLACPYFMAARKLAVLSCSYQPAVGESVTRLSNRLVAFYDPPGVHGRSEFSGWGNPTYGRVYFDPGQLSGAQRRSPFAAAATCTLPAGYKGLCPIVVKRLLQG